MLRALLALALSACCLVPNRPVEDASVPESVCPYPDIGVIDAVRMRDDDKAYKYRKCVVDYQTIRSLKRQGYSKREILEYLANRDRQIAPPVQFAEPRVQEDSSQWEPAYCSAYGVVSPGTWACNCRLGSGYQIRIVSRGVCPSVIQVDPVSGQWR
jgi:hypothetical protein